MIGELENLGVKIYIDSMDNKMPQQTCGGTAVRIKEVIKFCDKFILLATDKAIESYWCNWDLVVHINTETILPSYQSKKKEHMIFSIKGMNTLKFIRK